MSPESNNTPAVFVVKGSEPALVDHAVTRLLSDLTSTDGRADDAKRSTSDANSSIAIEEYRVPGPTASDEGVIGAVIDALFTPSFLAERRIVVLRDAENLDGSQASELASHLGESFAPNVLVLTVVAKSLPAPLAKAIKPVVREIETSPGSGKARTQWLYEQLQLASVHLEPAARQLLERHLGEDVSRLYALLDVLAAAYGEGASVTTAQLEPFLGEEGGAPPWDLTDALDRGDVQAAVAAAHRLLTSRHPFQLLSTLHRHYGAMLRLDGAGVSDPNAAAALLGMSAFPAGKVLKQANKIGPGRVARAVSLIADADLDLRGVVDWPDKLVIEVLVARLAQLGRSRPVAPVSSTGRR